MKRFLSLGAGVQSSTVALMSARGDLPMLDGAVFADTGAEPAAVYRHLDWLEAQLPFPVLRVAGTKTLLEALKDGDDAARVPFFVGGAGISGRQCTRNFKLRPIRQGVRKLLGVGPKAYLAPGSVEMWVGISTDEAFRMKPSGLQYIDNRHPLIEAWMSREDCKTWLRERQLPIPPKSSCKFCPYRGNRQWEAMRRDDPEEFADAVAVDRWLREPAQIARFHGQLYVHAQRRPLEEIDFAGLPGETLDLFNHECEGMCGV